MRFSTLQETKQSKANINNFYGYKHKLNNNTGEFYDQQNISSDNFPALSPRKARFITTEYVDGDAKEMVSKDSIDYVSDLFLKAGETVVPCDIFSEGEKQLVSMGAYVVLFPDGYYINTKDPEDKGWINNRFAPGFRPVKIEMCDLYGNAYIVKTTGPNMPQSPSDRDYWIDTSNEPHILKRYSAVTKMWTQIPTTYVRITEAGISKGFSKHDGVHIYGIENMLTYSGVGGDKVVILQDVHEKDPNIPNDEDFIVITGIADVAYNAGAEVIVERKMPIMDIVIEAGNRLWGCRYGENNNGEIVNEIYCSKQGDMKNWQSFVGTALDSWALSCGTDGPWTGAVEYHGNPVFFKEGYVHQISGSFPANYSASSMACKGVVKGAAKSIAVVNDVVYFKTRNGIGQYSGGLVAEMSDAFGDTKYTACDNADSLFSGAKAVGCNDKYYVNMKSEKDDKWYLFVYDTVRQMWNKEDEIKIGAWCAYKGRVHYTIENGPPDVMCMDREDSDPIYGKPEVVKWMAETGIMGTSSARTYISRVMLRMLMTVGSRVMIYLQYDSVGDWQHVCTVTGTAARTFSLPVRARRCDHFRMRIVGEGDVKIFSMTKTIEEGSDL